MSRNTWRNIFIGIILLTIPCYLFGIFVYYVNGGGVAATATPSAIPSRTPINVTELALTDPSLIVTAIILTDIPIPTQTEILIIPIVPTLSGGFTAIPFVTTTTVPTRFVSSTPTTPAPVVNTAIPANTAIPTATQVILLPASDTPSP